MKLAELIIDFVPSDCFLIYASISKEWLVEWKLRKRPLLTSVRHIVCNISMYQWSRHEHTHSSPIIIAHADLELIKFIYWRNHINWTILRPTDPQNMISIHCCNNARCPWQFVSISYFALLNRRPDVLQWMYTEGNTIGPYFVDILDREKIPHFEQWLALRSGDLSRYENSLFSWRVDVDYIWWR